MQKRFNARKAGLDKTMSESLAFAPSTPIVKPDGMTDCLIIKDITRLGRAPVDELLSSSGDLDPQDPSSCDIFSRHVAQVEGVLKQTYALAALLAKRSATPGQEAEIWQNMLEYAKGVMNALQQLKETYPQCGTPELHSLALDYWNAASERLSLVNESIQCQSLPMPAGLFPQTT